MQHEDGPTSQDVAPQFTETRWSMILLAGQDSSSRATAALEELCRTYWMPVYAFVRRNGYSPHDAQDLTQGFFASLLKNRWYRSADPLKGRFRSYLLGGLKHFLSDDWDKQRAAKRGGDQPAISLDDQDAENLYQQEPASEETPEKIFHRRWARTVLSQALDRLREEQARLGKAAQYELLKPFLTGDDELGGYEAAATALQTTPGNVAVTMHRLRQRFRDLVRVEISQTVSRPEDVIDEMRHLFD